MAGLALGGEFGIGEVGDVVFNIALPETRQGSDVDDFQVAALDFPVDGSLAYAKDFSYLALSYKSRNGVRRRLKAPNMIWHFVTNGWRLGISV